ncbi:MAG TPA: alpha/beta fold hydrolase [Steroidobacteraceae bacterium]|jgi:pimeloyl-ACP methyl ester carboxylesterase
MNTFWLRAPLLVAVLFWPAAHAVEVERPMVLASCRLADLARAARCGTLSVPENPDKPNGRRLSINVAVLAATRSPALADPIVVLQGGPGEDTIGSAEFYAQRFAPLLDDRDLLLIDQRGTGKSGALPCRLYSSTDPASSLRDIFPVAAAKRCAQRLQARADLTQYTYDRFAKDLEQVRREIGYGALNLYAGSYGTRAAQVYIRSFPASVRTAYLGSAVPIDAANPLSFAKTAESALELLFTSCSAEAACRSTYPKLREEFRAVMVRLDSGTVRVSIPGRAQKAALYRGRVAEWMRSKLYRPYSATQLPWLIHRAFAGDWNPLAKDLLADARDADRDFSFGLFFSITCSEDVAFIHEQDIGPETQGTFLGDYRIRQQQAACNQWPKTALPKDYRAPVMSAVPALFVSGDADGGTPLWYAKRVSAGFSNHLQVIAKGQGHTEWSDCIARLYQRMVRAGAVRGLDPSCPEVPRPPFKL